MLNMVRLIAPDLRHAKSITERLMNGHVDYAFKVKDNKFLIILMVVDLTRAKVCLSDLPFKIQFNDAVIDGLKNLRN